MITGNGNSPIFVEISHIAFRDVLHNIIFQFNAKYYTCVEFQNNSNCECTFCELKYAKLGAYFWTQQTEFWKKHKQNRKSASIEFIIEILRIDVVKMSLEIHRVQFKRFLMPLDLRCRISFGHELFTVFSENYYNQQMKSIQIKMLKEIKSNWIIIFRVKSHRKFS